MGSTAQWAGGLDGAEREEGRSPWAQALPPTPDSVSWPPIGEQPTPFQQDILP